MLNRYSFVKLTEFYNFWQTYTWIDSQQSNAYTVHSTYCMLLHYLVEITLYVFCAVSRWKLFMNYVGKQLNSKITQNCTDQFTSLPKIIKFGWDFTKLYQFNIEQHENVQFLLGHPVELLRYFYNLIMTCYWCYYSADTVEKTHWRVSIGVFTAYGICRCFVRHHDYESRRISALSLAAGITLNSCRSYREWTQVVPWVLLG